MSCKVARLDLGQPDAELLAHWTITGVDHQDRTVSGESMAQALRAEGHDVSNTAVKDHRAGRCRCNRKGRP